MKRIILSAIVMAFAVAAQAGDGKCCQGKDKGKEAAGCCGDKMKTSMQTKGTCPFAAKHAAAKQAAVKQTALLSPKAADALR